MFNKYTYRENDFRFLIVLVCLTACGKGAQPGTLLVNLTDPDYPVDT